MGGGVWTVVRCFTVRRPVETCWTARKVKMPGAGLAEKLEGRLENQRTKTEPEVVVWDIWGHGGLWRAWDHAVGGIQHAVCAAGDDAARAWKQGSSSARAGQAGGEAPPRPLRQNF